MADDTANICGDEDNAATLLSSFCLVECKTEPDTDLTNIADENISVFDELATLHIPVSTIPMIKNPIVLLERCDKIWKTLQLIRTIDKPIDEETLTDDCIQIKEEKKEEKAEDLTILDKIEQSPSYGTRNRLRRSDNTVPPLFKFSVQRTRKLYPCNTCGKQYLERRSLRKHSERVHGVVLPLLIRRKHWKRAALKKKNEAAVVAASIDKESKNSEKFHDNKNLYRKIITRSKLTSAATMSSTTTQFVTCTLCQRKVLSLRRHLIHYHKIGGSSVVKQLESSLLNETTSSENKRTLTNESYQHKYRITDNESNTHGRSLLKKKTNYTLPHANAKKRKLSNEQHDAPVQNQPAIAQKSILRNRPYKCDICLGIYSSTHSLAKHKRIHRIRGETKENFHRFKCRYFNSPLNQKCRLLFTPKASMAAIARIARNTNNKINDENNTLQLDNSQYNTYNTSLNRATRYSERMRKNNETTCICGRSFRNPHTLFIHKKHCEICQDIIPSTRFNLDRDYGLNITIKKRNDSYEIVGKDDEDKSQQSEISNLQKDTTPMSHTSNYTTDFTEATTRQQVTSESSKYSKDHSILKLQDADEDMIIDIEDDAQISLNEDNNTTEQTIVQEDGKQDLSEQQNDDTKDGKTGKILHKVTTLKEMCQKVLDGLEMRKFENIENENKDSQIKNQETSKENGQIENEEIYQENKRLLRSKRYQDFRVELDHSYDGTKDDTMKFDPFTCGYCKEIFNTVKSFNIHQCPVKRGKSYDEFSLQLLCFCCKEVLNNYNEFDEHVRTKHFDRIYHCYYCPEPFKSDKARLYHFHSEHSDMVCRFCNKKISVPAKPYHEAYHLGFGYPCHKCKRAYIHNKNLYHHEQKVHSDWAENLTTCTICLKLVKFKTFRRHMSAHTMKHNACDFCGKMFSDRIGVEYHIMMHHGTNTKLKCNLCGTRFHTKKQLEVHEKIDGCNNGRRRKRKLQ